MRQLGDTRVFRRNLPHVPRLTVKIRLNIPNCIFNEVLCGGVVVCLPITLNKDEPMRQNGPGAGRRYETRARHSRQVFRDIFDS